MTPPSPDFLRQLDTPNLPFSSARDGAILYTDPSGRFRFRFAGLKGSGAASFLHYAIDDFAPNSPLGGTPMTYSVYVRLVSDPRPSDERVRREVIRAFKSLGNMFTVDIEV